MGSILVGGNCGRIAWIEGSRIRGRKSRRVMSSRSMLPARRQHPSSKPVRLRISTGRIKLRALFSGMSVGATIEADYIQAFIFDGKLRKMTLF